MRIYNLDTTISFRKTNDKYGEFSNMAHGFPLTIDNKEFNSSEALYQALKFSERPDIQELILNSKNAMGAKFISRENDHLVDKDWKSKRVQAMKICLHIKHMQHLETLKSIFKETNGFEIVEFSNNDLFWGCALNHTINQYQGVNALGRLLMELRTISLSAKEIHFVPTNGLDVKLFGKQFGPKISKNGSYLL